MEMNTKQLTEYLKYAAELEASVHRQEEAKKLADREVKMITPRKKVLYEPKNSANGMSEPEMPAKMGGSKAIKVAFIWGICQTLLGVATIGLTFGVGLMNIVFGVAIFALGVYGKKWAKKSDDEGEQKYAEDMAKYEKDVVEANEKYEADMAQYYVDVKEAEASYNNEMALAQRNFNNARNAADQLILPLEETKAALAKLYDLDVIFPKYRDLVAMCTMYEYFAAGRCTELTGPNGAYNLYESELRQNLIINRLDTIINQLEQIKQNQYMLYTELQTTNKVLGEISGDIKGILNATQDIANSSRITAYCARVTAENTEALKYISLVNG